MAKVEKYFVLSSDELKALKQSSSLSLPLKETQPVDQDKGNVHLNGQDIHRHPYQNNEHYGQVLPDSRALIFDVFEAIPPELRIHCQYILDLLGQVSGFFISPHDFSIGINGQIFQRSNIIEILYGLLDPRLNPDLISGCKFCLALLSRVENVPFHFIKNHKALRILMKYKTDQKRKNKRRITRF